MKRFSVARTLPLLAAALALPAAAQHADFVLFGEPDADAAAVPANQRFVAPVTSPYFAENSFITSDVRAWYLYHEFPNNVLGGDVQVAAVQVRLALTDRLQLVAYKDGYAWFDDTVVNDQGMMDIAAGLKWNFYRDLEAQLSMALGVGYEIAAGDDDVLQDDDELRLWFSADKGFDDLHVGFTFNYFYPTGGEDALGDAERISWHVHLDYYLCECFSPVIEFNGYHTIDASSTMPLPFTGIDVTNLGGGESEDVITMGIGGAFRLSEDLSLRIGYEFPLTDDIDLFGDRWTLSLAWEF